MANINDISEDLLSAARFAVLRGNRATVFDEEIKELIIAARADLTGIGILPSKAYDDTDPLTRRAVILYVKAEFGLDNPDAQRYRESFDQIKRHLALSSDYISEE